VRIRGLVPAGLLTLLALAQSGCFPAIPYYDNRFPTRRNVEKALEAVPSVDRMSTEELLLRLGEPDRASSDGKTLTYRSTQICGVMLLPPGLFTSTEFRIFEVSDARVARMDEDSGWGFRFYPATAGVGMGDAWLGFWGAVGIFTFTPGGSTR